MGDALNLHVGHGKTGSSWIQSSLSLSRARLEAAGIDYPEEPGAAQGGPARVTSGNGKGLLVSEAALAERLAAHRGAAGRTLLFSSEYLFDEMADGAFEGFLRRVAAAHGFDRVRILLFIRDPLGEAASGWQQGVKRAGFVAPIESAFADIRPPWRVADVLERLEGLDGVEVTVRNYSRCRDRLLPETAAWLGLAPDALVEPPVKRVNRSMTRGELALQRSLNRRLGASGDLLSDLLCQRLPEVEPEDVRPPVEVQEAAWERLLPAVERVAARVPEAHRYGRDVRPPESGPLVLSEAQLDVIAAGFASAVVKRRALVADPAAKLSARRLASALQRRLRRRFAARVRRATRPIEERVTRRRVERFLRLARPVVTDVDLIRVGGPFDGGYLVPDDLEGLDACFSPGVDGVADFELAMAGRGVPIFMVDASVDGPPHHHALFDFRPLFLGTETAGRVVRLEDWVRAHVPDDASEMVLQMDVEGAEYDVVLDAPEALLKRFRIVIVEFHGLGDLFDPFKADRISRTFEKLGRLFHVVHAHPNNCEPARSSARHTLPDVMEFTFHRRDRARPAGEFARLPHALDAPNARDLREVAAPPEWR